MKILFPIHLYLPQHGAGGEMYVHNLAKYLISKGHEVRVLLKQAETYGITEIYTYEGVEVFPAHHQEEWHFWWCDIVISHLGYTDWAMQMAKTFTRPFVFIAHNDCFEEYENIYIPLPGFDINVIFNSWWIANSILKKCKEKNAATHCVCTVLHPMIDSDKFKFSTDPASNGFVLLVNCNENKGGKIFQKIVNTLPDIQFMAVKGGYDEQFIPEGNNCTIVPNTPNMGAVYAAARILLVPSKYESWGMVASEAMSAGIPVICTKTPGLIENCADAATYIDDREDVDQWVKAIKKLDNPKTYKKYSNLALQRSRQQDPVTELEGIEKFLYEAIQRTDIRVQQSASSD